MSVVVAVKENGVVYMGADSQITIERDKEIKHTLNDSSFKIRKLNNGILVGHCGDVQSAERIFSNQDILTLDENGMLTKKHIVTNIVPKLLEIIDEIGDKKKGIIDVTLILAYKESLYKIDDDLVTYKYNNYVKSGTGGAFVDYPLYLYRDLPIKERIVKALQESARRDLYVSAPFVLINTKEQKYEIVD